MSYPQFQDYMTRLKSQDDPEIKIHWPVIDIEAIEAYDQPARYGLQIADIAVSAITAGLEPDLYGNSELRYSRMLRPNIYHRKNNYFSYGVKMYPPASGLLLNDQQMEFVKLFGG